MNILMATADHLMIDRRILQEARTLIAAGHQVTLLAGFECPVRESYHLDGIRVERFVYDWNDSRFRAIAGRIRLQPGTVLHSQAWKLFRAWARLLAPLNSYEQFIFERMLEYQVDIIHAHDYPMLAPALKLAGVRRVPIVYDAHELYYAQVQLRPAVRRIYKRREANLITHCDAVITVNPFIADLMARRYRIATPSVILNASPIRPLSCKRLIRSRFGLSDDAHVVIYQGWISPNRGIERLVEAAANFPEDTFLVIIGYGDFEATLKQVVETRGLCRKVLFYGGVPSDELHEITCDADLGVIPYYGIDENNYYCSPNKLFEFCVAALPFICNDLPFLRSVVERFGNGCVADLNSAEAIARKINALFGDPVALAELRQGAMVARDSLNWSVEEKKLLAIYDCLPGTVN